MARHLSIFVAGISIILSLAGCSADKLEPGLIWLEPQTGSAREYSRVLTLVSVGTNNLDYNLLDDIKEMTDISAGAYVPDKYSDQAVLVVGHHLSNKPCLVQFYSHHGKLVRDTVQVFGDIERLTDSGSLKTIFQYISERYRSNHHGMIFSSHGTGWLPTGYYANGSLNMVPSGTGIPGHTPMRWEDFPGPPTKTLGSEKKGSSYAETEIYDFLKDFPVHFDYIFLDACLMGGIECVYEWKDHADLIAVSAAEIMADGLVYDNVTRNLLLNPGTGPVEVCRNFFEHYNAQTQADKRTATIALIDCSQLDDLTQTCRRMFKEYADQLETLDAGKVQGYFRFGRHYFYDLYDILDKAGAADSDLASLKQALDKCILYKNATPRIVDEFDVKTFCGLSMYIPNMGNSYLDSHYRKLAWNRQTGLVK